MDSFLSEEELKRVGFKKYGENVKISRYALFYGVEQMEFGDNVRIDDFCRLSGKINIGNYVHIAAYAALYGSVAGITFEDYSTVSVRTIIWASSDDYSGESMTNPTIPENLKNVINEPVKIGKHVVMGSACVVLPGVEVAEGTSVGAMSLINKSTEKWSVYVGIPAKKIKERSKLLLEKEILLEKEKIEFKNMGGVITNFILFLPSPYEKIYLMLYKEKLWLRNFMRKN